jgi:voltage-gated potassium channel
MKIAEYFIQTLIILSIIAFALETESSLQEKYSSFFNYFEIFTVIIFTIEYFIRILVSKKKLSYIFSFYGIVDLLAILPFYLNFGFDARSLRVIRIFKIFKFKQYNYAMKRYSLALNSIRNELAVFSLAAMFLLYISAVGIYFFEKDVQPEKFGSILDSMWWALVTLTTVGYGDTFPVTPLGKVFTSLIVVIGIAIIAIPTGLISSALTNTNNKK